MPYGPNPFVSMCQRLGMTLLSVSQVVSEAAMCSHCR